MKKGTAIIIGAGPAGLTAAIDPDRGWSRGRRHLSDHSLQRQPHGHWRPPLFLKIGPSDAVVAGPNAG